MLSHDIIKQRILEKVSMEPMSGCWIWLGATSVKEYALMWDGDRVSQAHRLSYMVFRGPIPHGLVTDHLCRVHCCVNPDHLEPVTSKVNTNRGLTGKTQKAKDATRRNAAKSSQMQAAREFCKNGHSFAEHGIPRGTTRRCMACERDWANKRTDRRRILTGKSRPRKEERLPLSHPMGNRDTLCSTVARPCLKQAPLLPSTSDIRQGQQPPTVTTPAAFSSRSPDAR